MPATVIPDFKVYFDLQTITLCLQPYQIYQEELKRTVSQIWCCIIMCVTKAIKGMIPTQFGTMYVLDGSLISKNNQIRHTVAVIKPHNSVQTVQFEGIKWIIFRI